MNENERTVLLQTRLRNLERKYSKLIQHADLIEEAIDTKEQINNIKDQLKMR